MKSTVSLCDFEDAFRSVRPNNFSYEGLIALFDYLENLEDDTGVELELDVIAFCCEYTEYGNIEDFNRNYNTEYESHQQIDETSVIPIDDNSFIIQNY